MAYDLHDRIANNLVTLIQGLSLTGLAGVAGNVGDHVYFGPREELERMVLEYPAVLVYTDDLTEEEEGGTFEADEVWYPVGVLILDTSLSNRRQANPIYRKWRRQIAGTLRGLVNPPLFADCPELVQVRLRNLPVSQVKVPQKEYVVSAFTTLWQSFEDRTRNDP